MANKVLFIDHHVSIRNDVKNLKIKNPHKIIYNEKKCASLLVWDYFYEKKKIPLFLKYINDNDTGTWKYLETDYFFNSIEIHFKTTDISFQNLKKWTKLLDDKYTKKLIQRGKIYYEYKNHLIKDTIKKKTVKFFPSKLFLDKNNEYFKTVGKYKVAILNGGCPHGSVVARELLKKNEFDFCLIWTLNLYNNIYICSLRSTKINVSKIAKYFGGGGHKLAAAFSLSSKKYKITDLFL